MDNFSLVGIQQVGVGTENMLDSWKWYADMFQMNVRVLEDDTIADRMLPYTSGRPEKRHACIAANLQGGGGLEIWQYSERKPVPLDFDVQVADLGVFVTKLKTHDISAYHNELAAKHPGVSQIYTDPRGIPTFYIHDPFGNMFQIVEDNYVFIDENRYSGGVVGVMVGVSDIEKSLTVYRDILGYDTVVYDKSGVFSDWQSLRGGNQQYRRMLLSRSKPFAGPFKNLYGNSTIELVQALERTPRKIFEKPRQWGDPGFIQICFDVVNMRAFEKHCESLGYPFTVDSCAGDEDFGMGLATGHFTYIEDPDGTLIEFVEVHKVPVSNKFNLCINLLKRDRTKPLPTFLFRLMRLNRVKFS
ncbi:MAG: VOC family protein [Bacteroidales bacterium]|nr:VOC family protein [Bacteroidales bacterium]MDY6348581.1 VOC family protein [Bacteroidales bacterium]